jgi:hypothetical protein
MENQDKAFFSGKLVALAIATGKYNGLEKPEISVYWDSLKDIPRAVIATALDECMKVYEHFPSVAEIRHQCDEVEEFVLKAQAQLPPGRLDPHETPLYSCSRCKDTGWHHGLICTVTDRCRMKSCIPLGDDEHVEHTYSAKCLCHTTNPVYGAQFKKPFYQDKRLGRKGY